MMRFLGKLFIYFVIFVFAVIMAANGYSPILTVGIALTVSLIGYMILFVYPFVLEKRVERVEDFLLRHKHKPGVYIHYVVANRLDDEAKTTMDKLMTKYKHSRALATYKAAYGLYCKDMDAIRTAVPYIRYADYRAYYATLLLIEDGKSTEAREHLESIKKRWMRSALLAEVERKSGDIEAAVKHAREAVDTSGGAQRYVLHKEYERTLPQAVERVS
ncbi:hypothetical protein [Paenibacillus camerounensis]|uniref:hypothetical protein n=1 Tax=Paenibacillus camerounensis TaxID=1243663 RepID=UPI0005A7487A|nr:hypothetical protein [Paenibacillus camerounensis]